LSSIGNHRAWQAWILEIPAAKPRIDSPSAHGNFPASSPMKLPFQIIIAPVILAHFGLLACGTVREMGKNSVNFVTTTAAATTKKVGALSELAVNTVHPPQVKIVEVRQKDLKKQLTGKDRVLAFENTRKRSFFSFFSGPVNFKEPILPQPGGEIDGSLLPPKEN
jgi:hypothetical protein